jgi:hypothetical protein
MLWLMLVVALAGLGCNRSPDVSDSSQKPPPHPTAPADWARRHGYDTGSPEPQRRPDAGGPAVVPPTPGGSGTAPNPAPPLQR